MMSVIGALAGLTEQTRFMVDTAIYFGFVAIVALSLGFMYRRAGVPFLGCSVPVMAGGLTVSAVATRLAFAAAGAAGVELLPYASDNDWVYNNEQNVGLVNEFLGSRPLLCLGFIAFILAASVAFGAASGWLISKPAIRLGPVYIMIATLTLTDFASVLGRVVVPRRGGGRQRRQGRG